MLDDDDDDDDEFEEVSTSEMTAASKKQKTGKEGAQPRESPQLAALRECATVPWEGARSGVQLVRVRQGLALPKALPQGLRSGRNLFLATVPRRHLTRFAELLLGMQLLEGDGGMWDARRAGCSAPHHQHYVANLASAAQLLKLEQTLIMRTLRARADVASTSEATALEATLCRALVSSVDNLKACSPGGRLGSAGVMLRFTDEQEYPWMRDASRAPYVPSMLGSKVPHPDRVAPTPRAAAAAPPCHLSPARALFPLLLRAQAPPLEQFDTNVATLHGDLPLKAQRNIEGAAFGGSHKLTRLVPLIDESQSRLSASNRQRLADHFEAFALVQTGSGGGGAVGRYAFAPVGGDVGPRSSGAAPYSVRLRKPNGTHVPVDLRVYHQALLFDPVEARGGGELSAVYDTLPGFNWERFEHLQAQTRARLFPDEPADDESQPVRAPSVLARLLAEVYNGAEGVRRQVRSHAECVAGGECANPPTRDGTASCAPPLDSLHPTALHILPMRLPCLKTTNLSHVLCSRCHNLHPPTRTSPGACRGRMPAQGEARRSPAQLLSQS